MNGDLEKLERQLERQMRVLDGLPLPPLPEETRARVCAAVQAEAGRLQRRYRRFAVGRRWGAVAAAIVLALGLGSTSNLLRVRTAPADDVALLSEWAQALDQSRDRFASVISDATAGATWSEPDDTLELDDLSNSLDEALRGGA